MRGALKNLPAHVQLLLTWAEQHADKSTQTPNHAEKPHTESAAQPDLKQQILSSLFLRDDTTYTVHKYSFGKLMRPTNARYTWKFSNTQTFSTYLELSSTLRNQPRRTTAEREHTPTSLLRQKARNQLKQQKTSLFIVHYSYAFNKMKPKTSPPRIFDIFRKNLLGQVLCILSFICQSWRGSSQPRTYVYLQSQTEMIECIQNTIEINF